VTCVGRRKSTFSNAILRVVSAMSSATIDDRVRRQKDEMDLF
jgi:hypothetical protein